MSEFCFCHLNGYKVKDSDARSEISKLKSDVELLTQTLHLNISNIVKSVDDIYERITFIEDEIFKSPLIDGGYNNDGAIWGDWDISNISEVMFSDGSESRSVTFNFFGKVDGKYIENGRGVIQDNVTGLNILVNDEVVYSVSSSTVYTNRLRDNIIGFGETPQYFNNSSAYMMDAMTFVGRATPITYSNNDDPENPDVPDVPDDSMLGGYDENGYLWGYWDISGIKDYFESSGSGRFKFYGYVDGVYIDGRTADINSAGGEGKIHIDGDIGTIYEFAYGSVSVNRLTNNTIGFGSTPQPLKTYQGEYYPDPNSTQWFIQFAVPTTKPTI